MVEDGLFSYLSTDSGITALVSTRVYPLRMPQNATLPAVTFTRISGPRSHALSGPTGCGMARIQIDAWATTYASAKAVIDTVRSALDGYSGTAGSETIKSSLLQTETDFYEPETNVYRVSQDYFIKYEE